MADGLIESGVVGSSCGWGEVEDVSVGGLFAVGDVVNRCPSSLICASLIICSLSFLFFPDKSARGCPSTLSASWSIFSPHVACFNCLLVVLSSFRRSRSSHSFSSSSSILFSSSSICRGVSVSRALTYPPRINFLLSVALCLVASGTSVDSPLISEVNFTMSYINRCFGMRTPYRRPSSIRYPLMCLISVERPALTSVAMDEVFSAVLLTTANTRLARLCALNSRSTSGAGAWGAARE